MSNKRNLSLDEREHIEVMIQQGFSYRDIAEMMHRGETTIRREIKKNGDYANYEAKKAQAEFEERRREGDRKRVKCMGTQNPFRLGDTKCPITPKRLIEVPFEDKLDFLSHKIDLLLIELLKLSYEPKIVGVSPLNPLPRGS